MKILLSIIVIAVFFSYSCSKKGSVDKETMGKQEGVIEKSVEDKTAVKKTTSKVEKMEPTIENLIKTLKSAGFSDEGSKYEPNYQIHRDQNILKKVIEDLYTTQVPIAATAYSSTTPRLYVFICEYDSKEKAETAANEIIKELLVIIPEMSSPQGKTYPDGTTLFLKDKYTEADIRKTAVANGKFLLVYAGKYIANSALTKAFKSF
ncbi:MAG: hypothetical protein KKH98_14850 [Spirochaetes bacterium]|nr:hypothetical protein [Spirochaetota bacterium]